MAERNYWPRGWRGMVLVLVGILMGATLLTPAVAHVGGSISHLWGAPGHIKAKVKSYGDSRWVLKTSAGAGPVAYARVNADGTLDTAKSKNVTASSLYTPGVNYYCIDVAVPFKTITVTAEGTVARIATAYPGDPFTSCAPFSPGQATGDATVHTFDAAGAAATSAFFIVFS